MRSLRRVTGQFNGTGAAVYLCIGAIPNYVRLINIEVSTNPNWAEWYRDMVGQVLAYGGIYCTGSTGAYTKLTTKGIFPYEGGELLTSTNQTDVDYGGGVYLGWDDKNYQADPHYGPASATTPINKWTLGSSTNRTGNFNTTGVSGNKILIGSIIRIKEDSTGLVKEAGITALTSATAFSTANYVELSRAIGTGAITFIGGGYQLSPIALGKYTPAGVYVADTASSAIVVNDNSILFDMHMEA